MTGCETISDCLPGVLSAVLSAVGPAKAEGPAKEGGWSRIAAAAEARARPRAHLAIFKIDRRVAQISKSAVSPISKSAPGVRVWKPNGT